MTIVMMMMEIMTMKMVVPVLRNFQISMLVFVFAILAMFLLVFVFAATEQAIHPNSDAPQRCRAPLPLAKTYLALAPTVNHGRRRWSRGGG